MKRLILWLVCASLFVMCSACSPPKKDPATLAYRELVSQLTIGSVEGVWSLLSKESKVVLAKRLSWDGAADTPPPNLALELDWAFESPFVGQATRALGSPEKGKEDSEAMRSDHHLRYVQTIYASQPWLIPVVFEGDKWRVHLMAARQKSAQP